MNTIGLVYGLEELHDSPHQKKTLRHRYMTARPTRCKHFSNSCSAPQTCTQNKLTVSSLSQDFPQTCGLVS